MKKKKFSQLIWGCLLFLVTASGYGSEIRGRVVDAETGEALPGAAVMIQNTGMGTETDGAGRFVLSGISENAVRLVIRLIGYEVKITEPIAAGTSGLEIRLQPRPIRFDAVVVTAAREAGFRSDLPQPASVLPGQRLRDMNLFHLGEALQSEIGAFVKEYGDFTAPQTISIRGSSEGQVLVLLNGQRLNLPQGGGVDFSTLPLFGIDRVEVIRGASSSLYGSDAIAGVVNLIPIRSPKGRSLSVRTRFTGGSWGLRERGLRLATAKDELSAWTSFHRIHSNGDYEYRLPDGTVKRRQNNAYDGTVWLGQVAYGNVAGGELKVLGHYFQKNQGDPGRIGFESSTAKKDETRQFWAVSYFRALGYGSEFQFHLYQNRYDQRYEEPAFGIRSRHRNRTEGLQAQLSLQAASTVRFLFGYEFRTERLNSSDVGRQRRSVHGLFVQTRLQLFRFGAHAGVPEQSRLLILPSLRFDRYDNISELNPRIGVLYSVFRTGKLTLRANLGRSFRMPSFFDLYWPEDMWSAGNPDLKPEIGFTYDAGFLWQVPLGRQQNHLLAVEGTYFVNRLKDLIVWGPASDGKWRPDNVDRARIAGVEARAEWQWIPVGFSLSAGYTFMNAENDAAGTPAYRKQLIYRPQNKADVRLAFRKAGIEVAYRFRYVDKRFTKEDNSAFLPAYRTSDVFVSLTLHWNRFEVPVRIGVFNLFDRTFEVLEGYPHPGRQLRLNVGLNY